MNREFYDERIQSETNKVFKMCFTILTLLILTDVVIKMSMWELSDGFELNFIVTVGIEVLILFSIFLLATIQLIQKGISLGASDLMESSFPKNRYFKISLVIGFIFGLSTIFRMIYFGRSPNYLILDILFGIGFYLVVWTLTTIIFYVYFHIVFKLAKKKYNKSFEEFSA